MEDERVDVGPEFGYDEWDALGHQPRDQRNVAAEPVEFGHDDRTPELARPVQGQAQLRPEIERIGALARFDLDMFGCDDKPFARGEAGNGLALRLDAEARPALLARRDADIGDEWPRDVMATNRLAFLQK